MKHFELVVLDLDGTLLDPEREAPVRPAVKASVCSVLQRGIGVTLATGRTWDYARNRMRELGLSLPIVSSHGATLVDLDGTVLREHYLEEALAFELAQRCQNLPPVFAFYFRHKINKEMIIRQNRVLLPMAVYHHLLGVETEVDENLAAYLKDYQVIKFAVFDEDAQAAQYWGQWAGPGVDVSRTHHLLVEATAPGVNKGTGVAQLIEYLQIDPERVLAVGDNFNDLPMFRVVGTSVAMGQAPEAVKKAADWIAPAFLEDGVAAALERYILHS